MLTEINTELDSLMLNEVDIDADINLLKLKLGKSYDVGSLVDVLWLVLINAEVEPDSLALNEPLMELLKDLVTKADVDWLILTGVLPYQTTFEVISWFSSPSVKLFNKLCAVETD